MRSFSDLPVIELEFLLQRCSAVDGCLLWLGQLRHGPCVMIARANSTRCGIWSGGRWGMV